MTAQSINASSFTKFSNVLCVIVNSFQQNKSFITIPQIVDALCVIADPDNKFTYYDRRGVNNMVFRRVRRLCAVGCLNCTVYPAPAASHYALTQRAIERLVNAATNDCATELMEEFELKDSVYEYKNITRHKPPKREAAETTNQAAPRRYTYPDGSFIDFPTYAEFISFMADHTRQAKQAAQTLATTEQVGAEIDVVGVNETIAIIVAHVAGGYSTGIQALYNKAKETNREVSARVLSIAMSQANDVLAGFKYHISHTVCVETNEIPCNTNDCNMVSLPPRYETEVVNFVKDLSLAAEAAAKVDDNRTITLPTMNAENRKDPGKNEPIPGTFRASPHQVAWDFKGQHLPSHLQRMLDEIRQRRAEEKEKRKQTTK